MKLARKGSQTVLWEEGEEKRKEERNTINKKKKKNATHQKILNGMRVKETDRLVKREKETEGFIH